MTIRGKYRLGMVLRSIALDGISESVFRQIMFSVLRDVPEAQSGRFLGRKRVPDSESNL